MPNVPVTRILDAAANRAAEGLRVVEDYVRFVLDDSHLTQLLKQLRHDLAQTCAALPQADRCTARDTQHDVGTEITTDAESERTDAWDVCLASFERAKQSLRSLEEFSKVTSPEMAGRFETLRYRLYTLEKAIGITHESCSRLSNSNLCVLIDGQATAEEFKQLLKKILNAGVGMIQLRDNKLPDRELLERAHTLVSQSKKRRDSSRPPLPHTLTIINNRPDIAVASHADGVHLGQDDLTAKAARAILGPRKLIGISTHSIEQARRAVLDGANYLGAGPTFPSATKSFDAFPGLDYLRQIATEISLPIFAIGGIQAENLAEVLETGVNRVAVSGAVAKAPDPGEAASKLMEILRNAATR
ncbi:MAG: thiamine phosphate synthase [Planctomycetes bacterium]|nr:thiamine phosphate synthase [Planctomycetota bacterium]